MVIGATTGDATARGQAAGALASAEGSFSDLGSNILASMLGGVFKFAAGVVCWEDAICCRACSVGRVCAGES